MKKLLGIVVLGLLLSGNVYANTNNKEIINKKLYEEYSTCTVYFKFLSIAKEKQGKYKKKKSEKDFLERMQELTTISEKNTFYFADILKISTEDVQKTIEEKYTEMYILKPKGYGLKKLSIVANKYFTECIEIVDKPKETRIFYWTRKIEENNEETKIENLTGTKLFCKGSNVNTPISAIDFFAPGSLRAFHLRTNDWKIDIYDNFYSTTASEIKIYVKKNKKDYLGSIFRQSLNYVNKKCEILASDTNVYEMIKEVLIQTKKNLKKSNKI